MQAESASTCQGNGRTVRGTWATTYELGGARRLGEESRRCGGTRRSGTWNLGRRSGAVQSQDGSLRGGAKR
jgi:hypothetical protein